MTTSPIPFLFEVNRPDVVVPERKRIYFQERFRNRLYDLIIREFKEKSESGLTKKQLAARLQKRPEQITRWLAAPGNLTLDTVSDLLLGICGAEPQIGVGVLAEQAVRNQQRPEWLVAQPKIETIGSKETSTTSFVTFEITSGEGFSAPSARTIQATPATQNRVISIKSEAA